MVSSPMFRDNSSKLVPMLINPLHLVLDSKMETMTNTQLLSLSKPKTEMETISIKEEIHLKSRFKDPMDPLMPKSKTMTMELTLWTTSLMTLANTGIVMTLVT